MVFRIISARLVTRQDVLEKIEESEYGKFAWVMDPEGNKVELWQPPPGQ